MKFWVKVVISGIIVSIVTEVKCLQEDSSDGNHSKSIRSIFSLIRNRNKEYSSTEEGQLTNRQPQKESGQFDFFGRDVIKYIGNRINDIGQTLGIKSTQGLDTQKSFSGIQGFKKDLSLIYPGTHWCGNGDIAENNDDLGIFNKEDSCCRTHDKCDENLKAGEIRNGLENSGLFTRSSCKCDRRFYSCLKAVKSLISYEIGTTYFTVAGPQCFKLEYPIIHCKSKKLNRCVSYKLDKSQPKIYQWFDNPVF